MTPLRKALAAGAVALALASVPSRLVAEESRAAPAQARSSDLGWFSGLWSDLTALFAAEIPPAPTTPGDGPTTDDACSMDPWGRCTGG